MTRGWRGGTIATAYWDKTSFSSVALVAWFAGLRVEGSFRPREVNYIISAVSCYPRYPLKQRRETNCRYYNKFRLDRTITAPSSSQGTFHTTVPATFASSPASYAPSHPYSPAHTPPRSSSAYPSSMIHLRCPPTSSYPSHAQ
jgi:hypothetical protein